MVHISLVFFVKNGRRLSSWHVRLVESVYGMVQYSTVHTQRQIAQRAFGAKKREFSTCRAAFTGCQSRKVKKYKLVIWPMCVLFTLFLSLPLFHYFRLRYLIFALIFPNSQAYFNSLDLYLLQSMVESKLFRFLNGDRWDSRKRLAGKPMDSPT